MCRKIADVDGPTNGGTRHSYALTTTNGARPRV